MKKWLIIILMVLCTNFTIADEGLIEIYKPTEVINLNIHLLNETGNVEGANCSIQIRNESYGQLVNKNMNEIGGGWYNYTYNTSKVGTYFCRQNCTKGSQFIAGTCDFTIKGDETMNLAVVIVVLFVIVMYLLLIRLFTMEAFSEHGLLRLLCILTGFWLLLLPINIAVQINIFNGGPEIVTTNLNLLYMISIWLNTLITFYFVIWFSVQIFNKLLFINKRRKETDEGDEEE